MFFSNEMSQKTTHCARGTKGLSTFRFCRRVSDGRQFLAKGVDGDRISTFPSDLGGRSSLRRPKSMGCWIPPSSLWQPKKNHEGGECKEEQAGWGGEVPLVSRKALIFHIFCCSVVCQNGRCILLFDAIDTKSRMMGPGWNVWVSLSFLRSEQARVGLWS